MKKEPKIFTQINMQNVPVSTGVLDTLEQEVVNESAVREYIRELLLEWEPANDQNLMLDQEGMEKSDRENVSQYLKSMGLLELKTR